ncbi:MAG: ATP synthase subunit I [Deltaproteobacteria bacterium]|nr:ATP synthase subunit I [Deltaproteobacteria bacterium]
MSLVEKATAQTEDNFKQFSRIEWCNLVLLFSGTLASLYFWDFRISLGFFLGSLISTLNLRLLRWIVGGLTQDKSIAKSKLIAQILLKFFGMFAAIGLVVMYVDVHAIALLLGVSTVVLAIVLEGIQGLFRRS